MKVKNRAVLIRSMIIKHTGMTVPQKNTIFRGSQTFSTFPETNVYAKKHPRFLCIINYNKSISLIEGICQLSYYNKMTANKDKLLSKTQIIIVVRLAFGNDILYSNIRSYRFHCFLSYAGNQCKFRDV